MQLLVTGKARYHVYKAWGRVGGEEHAAGRMNSDLTHKHEGDLAGAKKEFHVKFRELACVDFETCEPPFQVRVCLSRPTYS